MRLPGADPWGPRYAQGAGETPGAPAGRYRGRLLRRSGRPAAHPGSVPPPGPSGRSVSRATPSPIGPAGVKPRLGPAPSRPFPALGAEAAEFQPGGGGSVTTSLHRHIVDHKGNLCAPSLHVQFGKLAFDQSSLRLSCVGTPALASARLVQFLQMITETLKSKLSDLRVCIERRELKAEGLCASEAMCQGHWVRGKQSPIVGRLAPNAAFCLTVVKPQSDRVLLKAPQLDGRREARGNVDDGLVLLTAKDQRRSRASQPSGDVIARAKCQSHGRRVVHRRLRGSLRPSV